MKNFKNQNRTNRVLIYSKLIATTAFLMLIGSSITLAQPNFSGGGTGTSSNPYKLKTKADLDILADWINRENGKNANGAWSSSGKYFRLEQDITESFTRPIGREGLDFQGTFDGNCKKIKLHMDYGHETKPPFYPDHHIGLFGAAAYATIKNVTVEGTVVGTHTVAGIVAGTGGTTITNCTNLATIEVSESDTSYGGTAGGIVGYVWYDVTIEGCTNAGIIKGNWLIGGMIGWVALKGRIRNCANIGTIHADISDAGGIAGRIGYNEDIAPNNYSIIEHCMNAGFVYARWLSGGIVGSDWGFHNIVRNCLNVGVVHKTEDITDGDPKGSNSSMGAILGRSHQSNTSVQNCAYDSQMYYDSAKQASPNSNINQRRYTGIGGVADNYTRVQPFSTYQIILGSSLTNPLAAKLGTTYWTYTSNAYPTLKNSGACGSCSYLLHYVAGSPLILKKQYDSNVLNTVNCVDTTYECLRYNNSSVVAWTAKNNHPEHNPNRLLSDVLYASASCNGYLYRKEIPIIIVPDSTGKGTWFKTSNQSEELDLGYKFAFTVSEINPTIASDNASFDVSTSESGNLSVSIWDNTGAKVMNVEESFMEANTERTIQMNGLSTLATGTYYVVVYFDTQVVMRKFVKQ